MGEVSGPTIYIPDASSPKTKDAARNLGGFGCLSFWDIPIFTGEMIPFNKDVSPNSAS